MDADTADLGLVEDSLPGLSEVVERGARLLRRRKDPGARLRKGPEKGYGVIVEEDHLLAGLGVG